MKTKILFLLLSTTLLNGCMSKKHMDYYEIPIDGNFNEFANELTKQGYTDPTLTNENQIKLKGVFLEKSCEVFVYGTRKSKTAYKVRVNLPKEAQDSLEYNFEKMKKQFSSKFGIGTNKYQQFQNAERFLFNEPKRTRQIQIGDLTRFTTGSGFITLEVRDGYISIVYTDKLNSEISKREIEEENKKPTDEV